MTNRLTKLSRTTYVPGVAYVAPSPARCYTDYYTTTIYAELGQTLNGSFIKSTTSTALKTLSAVLKKANFVQTSLGGVPVGNDKNGNLIFPPIVKVYYYVYTTKTPVTRCDPANPGTPGRAASYTVDNQRGWTGGGRSRQGMAADLIAQFNVSGLPTGIVCGLASGSFSTDIGAIEHGIYATVGQFWVFESGNAVLQVPGISPLSQPRISISRTGTKVTYTIGAWQYTSLRASVGAKYLQSSLYVAGDFVDSPSLVNAVALSGIGQAGVSGALDQGLFGGVGQAGTTAQGFLETSANDRSLGGIAQAGVTCSNLIETVTGFGGTAQAGVTGLDLGQSSGAVGLGFAVSGADRAYAHGNAKLPALVVNAYGGFPIVADGGGQINIPVYTGGDMKTGGVGSGSVELGLVLRGSQGVYGEGRIGLPPLEVSSFTEPYTNAITVATRLGIADSYFFQPTVFIMVNEGLRVGGTLDLVFVFQEDMAETLGIGDRASATFLIDLLINSGLNVGDDLSQVKQDLAQYATNMITGGVTRYDGFGFSSFIQVGLRSFGLRPDGIYELTGDTDNGALITGIVDFVTEDFGTAMRKRVDNVYVGIATDGQVFVRLNDDDGRAITYRASQHGSTMKVRAAKGVSSRFWNMRLEIVSASYAEVDNIEWYVGATGRRLGR